MKKRIILDVDMGSDDTVCLWLAMLHRKIKVDGITLVHGNTTMENVRKNIFKALDMINQNGKVKVYEGESSPIKDYGFNTDDDAHGSNGFSGLIYDEVPGKIEEISAIDYLINHVNNNPHKITIIAVGPLTNIAKAILKDKNFAKNIKELIIMGGAENYGNITPYAEFNFYKDPAAAKIVFNAPITKIVMMGYNITKKVFIDHQMEKLLKNSTNLKARFLYDISRSCAKISIESGAAKGATINDAINICYLINKSCVLLQKCSIDIETQNLERLAESKVNYPKKGNCFILKDVNKRKCQQIIFNTIFPELKKEFKKVI